MADVILCAPATFWLRYVGECPTCNRRRRFVSMRQVWYDPTDTCLGCGDHWTDGSRHPRPFQRGWRAEAVAYARARWAEGGDRDAYDAWWRQQMRLLDEDMAAARSGEERP